MIPALGRQRQQPTYLCEFEHRVSFRTARATQINPVWKKQTNKQTNKQTKKKGNPKANT